MPRKKHKPEEIVAKLRQVDVPLSQGQAPKPDFVSNEAPPSRALRIADRLLGRAILLTGLQ